jgi:hypothetical protein
MITCDPAIIYLVRNDNGSQLECRLTRDDTDLPVDLTNAVVRLKFRKKKATTILFTLLNIIVPSVNLPLGQALFEFSSANLDIPEGDYEGEIEVTFANGNIDTVYELITFKVRNDF